MVKKKRKEAKEKKEIPMKINNAINQGGLNQESTSEPNRWLE